MKTIQWLVATAAVSLSLPVFAVTSTFDFTAANPTSTTNFNPYGSGQTTNAIGTQDISTEYGNTLTFKATSGATTGATSAVTVSAYASTGSATVGGAANTNKTTQQIQTAITTFYSGNGLAITSANGTTNPYGSDAEFSGCSGSNVGKGSGTGCADIVPNHAMDNDGAYEALLLSFSSKVSLTNFTLGYANPSNGADTTVLYYTGSGTPAQVTAALTANSFASLLSNGWAVASGTQYSNDTTNSVVSVGLSAQYFMIGAYIPLGQSSPGNDGAADYVKLKSITTATAVPEPDSIALFGIAGAALFIGRRRRSARAV